MRIDEKTRNVHFQWERDSSRSYSYTPSLSLRLYGKPLILSERGARGCIPLRGNILLCGSPF